MPFPSSNKKNKGLKIKNTSFWFSCLLMLGRWSDWKTCVVKFGKFVCQKLMFLSDWSTVCKVESRFGVEVNNGEDIEAGAVGA